MNQQSAYNNTGTTNSQPVQSPVNMAGTERNLSMLGGAALIAVGLFRRGKLGVGLGTLGAALLVKGAVGISSLYKMIGQNRAVENESARVSVPHQQGHRVTASVTIDRPAEEIYRFWRDFNNLPRFMPYVEVVEVKDDTHSHWAVSGPLGTTVEWNAEIINDEPNRVIGWRTLENPFVNHAGSVRFTPAPTGEATEVRVELEYLPLGGDAGAAFAKVLGHSPQQQVTESLQALKTLLETSAAAAEASESDPQTHSSY